MNELQRKELMDDEGENQAVRSFLLQYSCDRAISVSSMREHMRLSGWDGMWPQFVANARPNEHLTKAGAQLWIRHLFALENVIPSPWTSEKPVTGDTITIAGITYKRLPNDKLDAVKAAGGTVK